MCDYSLHNVAPRPAKVSDKLVTTQFPNTITRGFSDPSNPYVAVCLLPGTELAFEKEVECKRSFGFLPTPARSISIGRRRTMMRWSSPTERSGWLQIFARVSTRRCCNCRAPGSPRLSQANKWCQRELPKSPDPADVRERYPVALASTKRRLRNWGCV